MRGGAMPYLEIKLGPDTLLLRFVGRIDYVFGRLPRADVQLRDMKVSRLHTQCFIDSRGNAFVLDLGSSGGTYINNQRLRRGVVAPLTNGVKFRTGDARITFYDDEPPVNAIEPPGQSEPRGLIRTNHRQRYFEAEQTVLAMNKVDPETQSGPAEPPPELNPADFADGPADLEVKPAAAPKPPASAVKPPTAGVKAPLPPAKVPAKRNTGIVQAPWEKPAPAGPAKEKRVTIPPPTRGGKPVPAPMPSADVDELGNYSSPAASGQRPPSAPMQRPPAALRQAPADGIDPTGRTSREPVVPDSGAFRPPPPITGEMRAEDDEPPQRVGLPTVRLERPAIQDRQRQIEEEEAAEAAALRIPTASVRPPEPPAPVEEVEPAPQIGMAPKRESASADDTIDNSAEDQEDLTDDQITEYLGGSVSGRFGDIDFGDKTREEPETEEVSFGSAAQVGLEGDVDIDVDDPVPATSAEPAAAAEDAEAAADDHSEFKESSTSMLGATTAVKEDPVEDHEEHFEEPAEELVEEPVEVPVEVPVEETPVIEDITGEVPSYEETGTPPPPSREGATEDRTFKPRKTRKLMKRRKDTAKITDKSNPTPLPEGAKTVHIPLPTDQPVVAGAKTMFIPKPDDAKISRAEGPGFPERPTGKPKAVPENRQPKTLNEMGEGPGGDTVAMPPAMMKQLQDELRKQYAKKEEAKEVKKEEPPTIGENPTVKLSDDEEEDEFVLDEDYAFFTPPPATRKARDAAARLEQSDVINANDFTDETDNLPPNKKAASKEDPDTLVD